MEIGMLGSLEVRLDGEPVTIRRGRPRELLCSLVLHRGDAVAFDTLTEHLWGDDLPANPANALQTQMAYLRRSLGDVGRSVLVTRSTGYALDVDAKSIDAVRFESMVDEGRGLLRRAAPDGLERAVDVLSAALALWRGPAYAEVADAEWARSEIVRLDELRLAAIEARLEAQLGLGRSGDVAAELASLVGDHPLRERLWELLMVALYRSGRQAEALRAYYRVRKHLVDELGIEPGPSLRALEQQVLDHDDRLDLVAPVTGAEPGGRSVSPGQPAPAAVLAPPVPVTELLGREREIERATELLDERRLLTLVGPGGTGKTRLAIALASHHRGGPVRYVDLASVEDPEAVGTTVAAALQAPATDANAAPASVVEALAGSRALVVFDTCERVRSGLGPLVERIRAGAPDVTILATSRLPLGVSDELALPVPPLDLPGDDDDPAASPAVQLFLRRARSVNVDLQMSPATLRTVAAICRALDGLPLAIELAATQMDVLSPEVVLATLESGNLLPATGGPGHRRQQALSATIDWSMDLLDDSARDLLCRLSVFPSTFDLEAATALAPADSAQPLEDLLALLRASLVASTSDGRHRLLDTVRSHVKATQAEAPCIADARTRHAAHFARIAGHATVDIRTAQQNRWFPSLAADLPNFHAALDWCFSSLGDEQLGAALAADIAWIWTLQGNLVDARGALDRAAAVDTPPVVRRRVLLGLGLLAAPLGDLQTARDACAASAAIARQLGDSRGVADGLLTLGVAQWGLGELAAAADSHDEAITRYDQLRDAPGSTICRILRARTARDQGDLATCESLLAYSVDAARGTGDTHIVGLAFEQHARLALARGDLDAAADAANRCLEHNEAINYAEGICAALGILARVRIAARDLGVANAMERRALGLATHIRHAGAQCEALEILAEIEAAAGHAESAAVLLLQADRARMRQSLPLASSDAARVEALRVELENSLGRRWSEVVRRVSFTPLEETARSMIDA